MKSLLKKKSLFQFCSLFCSDLKEVKNWLLQGNSPTGGYIPVYFLFQFYKEIVSNISSLLIYSLCFAKE